MDSFPPPQRFEEPRHEEPPRRRFGFLYALAGSLLLAAMAARWAREWVATRGGAPDEPAAPEKSAQKKGKGAVTPPLVGDSRDRAVELLGEPKSLGRMGSQEFLIYSNGEIIVEKGLVISVEWGKDRKRGEVQSGPAQIILREGGKIQEGRSP